MKNDRVGRAIRLFCRERALRNSRPWETGGIERSADTDALESCYEEYEGLSGPARWTVAASAYGGAMCYCLRMTPPTYPAMISHERFIESLGALLRLHARLRDDDAYREAVERELARHYATWQAKRAWRNLPWWKRLWEVIWG